jgi:hypothetical protein
MITMIGHAIEATEEGGFLLAGPLCEACERPLDRDAVIRSHRRVHRPKWQPSALETRVRFVWLCAACGDDPRWLDWPPVSLEEREALLGLLAQIGLRAFVETQDK